MTENGLEVCAHDVIGVIDRTNAELDHSTTPRSAGSCRLLGARGPVGDRASACRAPEGARNSQGRLGHVGPCIQNSFFGRGVCFAQTLRWGRGEQPGVPRANGGLRLDVVICHRKPFFFELNRVRLDDVIAMQCTDPTRTNLIRNWRPWEPRAHRSQSKPCEAKQVPWEGLQLDDERPHMLWPPRRRCLPGKSTSGWHTR